MEASNNFFQQAKQILKTIAMIVSWTIFALLVLIIGFLAYYMVSANIYAKKGEKFEPKFSLYTIVSPSMEPNIKVYDVILNTRVDDASDIKVGDVITFISTSTISNGMTVTHRVTRIENGPDGLEFATKGDNNTTEDTDTAKQANLLGKVVLKIPQLGRLQFFLSTKGGWLLVIIFPALLIIVNDIFKIFKLNKAKKNLKEAEEIEENKEEKIKLETFRKDEIKNKLNKKELKKAKILENKIKNSDVEAEVDNKEINNPIVNTKVEIAKEKTEEEAEFIPVIEEKDLAKTEESKYEHDASTENEQLIDEDNKIKQDNVSKEEDLKELEEEIIFEPVASKVENSNNEDTKENNALNDKNLNNKEEKIIFEPVKIDNEQANDENIQVENTNIEKIKEPESLEINNQNNNSQVKNIFDEEEPYNIFTENNALELFEKEEPIKKENDIPLNIELPKLKNQK